jgi:hypothetical protein
MYRSYNRPRQCCEKSTAGQETFNDVRNSYTPNNCAAHAQNNCSDYPVNNCRSDNNEETMHRHHQRKEHMPIGMAYVPMQEWSEMYEPCEGLYEGSAFPELNLIFCGVRGN